MVGEGRCKTSLINYFVETVKKDPEYADLSAEQIESLHNTIWIIATGLAALMSSSIIHPTKEQIEKMIQDSINATLNTKETIQVN